MLKLLTAIIALTIGGTASWANPNLLGNHEFKTIDPKRDLPVGWTLLIPFTGERIAHPDNPARFALKLTASENDRHPAWMQGGIKLKPAVNYQLTCRVRADKGNKFRVYMESNKPWKTISSSWQEATGEWQECRLNVNFDKLENLPYLVLQVQSPGTAVFADCSLSEIQPRTQIDNPGFEEGSSSWILSPQGASIIAGNAFQGKHSLLLTGTNPAVHPRAFQENIILTPSTLYELSFNVIGESGSSDLTGANWFRVYPQWGKHSPEQTLQWLDVLNGWQKKTVRFTSPGTPVSASIICELKSPGRVRIDNVSLNPLPPPEPLKLSLATDLYRDSFHASAPRQTFSAIVKAHDQNITKVDLTLRGADGHIIQQQTIKPAQTDKVEFQPGTQPPYSLEAIAGGLRNENIASAKIQLHNNPPSPYEVTFDQNNNTLINGKKFFPIGVWGIPSDDISSAFAIYANSGINTVLMHADSSILELAQLHGLKIIRWIPEILPYPDSASSRQRWQQLQQSRIQNLANSPALLAHVISDEPLWRGIELEPLLESYKFHRQIDPHHPILMNAAPRNTIPMLSAYAQACDAYGVDIYPIPAGNTHSELDDKSPSCVGKYTDICRKVVNDRKPVWMTLQHFSWDVLRAEDKKIPPDLGSAIFPSHHELRFMAYNAITHGANGLLFWGGKHPATPQYLQDFHRLTFELSQLVNVFTAQNITPPSISANNPGIHIMQRRMGQKDFFLVVNESNQPITAEFAVPDSFPANLAVWSENRVINIDKNKFSDQFSPYQVHIYTTDNSFPFLPQAPANTKKIAWNNEKHQLAQSSWIWYPKKNQQAGHRCYLRQNFQINGKISAANLYITADDNYRVYLNGILCGSDIDNLQDGWVSVEKYDISSLLRQGKNTIAVEAWDSGNPPCGMMSAIHVSMDNGRKIIHVSGPGFLSSTHGGENWKLPEFDDSSWSPAEIVAPPGHSPWKNNFYIQKGINTD